MLKLQELQTHKSTGYISIPFSAVWSQDNFLAFITDKGVNVLETRCSGVSKENKTIVKRWFVKARPYFPTCDCMINVAKLGETLAPLELFRLMLDRTLSPQASISEPHVHPSSVAFSPFHPHFSQTSLLTILTDYGSLDVYKYGETGWNLVGCVTESWLNICRKQWDNNSILTHSPDDIVTELKRRAYRLKITAFAWGRCQEGKWMNLFTANMCGEIMEWKLEMADGSVTITNQFVLSTDLDSITSIHSLALDLTSNTYMLLAGCLTGKIQCLSVKSGSGIATKSMVWSDLDQMPVAQNGPVGVLLPQGVLYLVPKMSHLLVFWLDSEANLINFTTYSISDILITGICWMKGSEFLVVTRCGQLLGVSASFSSSSLDVSVKSFEPFSKNNSCSYHGIAASPSKCMLAVPYCVCQPHDPSVVKEPTTLGLFFDADRLNQQEFLDLKVESFFNIWDYLELFRLDFLGRKELESKEAESPENYDSSDIVDLKKAYWLNRCLLTSYEINRPLTYKQLETLCKELKRAIISHQLFTRVQQLLTGSEDLSDQEKESLVCSKRWLSDYSSTALLKSYKRKAEILLRSLKHLKDKETCPLCQSDCLDIDGELMMKCQQGHSLPRCPRTLLPLVFPPYYTCYFCNETSTFGEGLLQVCVLCDAPLKFNQLLLRD